MTRLEIEAFLMIVKMGSISQAAQKLFITQPALSRRVAILEKELGYEVFIRSKGIRNVELTPAGQAFIPIAGRWMRIYQEALSLQEVNKQTPLRLGAVSSVGTYILPTVLQQYKQRQEGSRLEYRDYRSREAYEAIENGAVDLALITDVTYDKTVQAIPLFQEKMVLLTEKNNPLSKSISAEDLAAEQEVRLPWYPEYELWHDHLFGSKALNSVFMDQMYMLEYFLLTAGAWAIVPATAAISLQKRLPVKAVELKDGPPPRFVYCLSTYKSLGPQQLLFFTLLKKYLSKVRGVTVLKDIFQTGIKA